MTTNINSCHLHFNHGEKCCSSVHWAAQETGEVTLRVTEPAGEPTSHPQSLSFLEQEAASPVLPNSSWFVVDKRSLCSLQLCLHQGSLTSQTEIFTKERG
jgi:hypothetical protein